MINDSVNSRAANVAFARTVNHAFDDSRNPVYIFIYRRFERVCSVKVRVVENKATSFNRQTS